MKHHKKRDIVLIGNKFYVVLGEKEFDWGWKIKNLLVTISVGSKDGVFKNGKEIIKISDDKHKTWEDYLASEKKRLADIELEYEELKKKLASPEFDAFAEKELKNVH